MEIQILINSLRKDIEEKNYIISAMEAVNSDTRTIRMELEIAIENYSSIFNAIPMLM